MTKTKEDIEKWANMAIQSARDVKTYRVGEKGLFFDCHPYEAVEKYMNGDMSKMHKGKVTEGCGKYQVSSETAYWNYYIPAPYLFGLWNVKLEVKGN